MITKIKLTLMILVLGMLASLAYLTLYPKKFSNGKFFLAQIFPSLFQREISVLNFGDAMFGRNVGKKMSAGLNPFEYINSSTSPVISESDFVILNLEGPITSLRDCQKKAYSFRFEPSVTNLLRDNNIKAVNLANNHSYDCFGRGLSDTEKYLTDAGIGFFGGEKVIKSPLILRIGEQKVAFVGINLTFNLTLDGAYLELVKKLKSEGNTVIVHIHWGNEYELRASFGQVKVGHSLIDSGADAIIGHHPHVIQPLEIYKNRPIFYSLGNFIFDQIDPPTKKGIGVRLIIRDNLTAVEIIPFSIVNTQPRLLNGKDRVAFCNEFLKNIAQEFLKAQCLFKWAAIP